MLHAQLHTIYICTFCIVHLQALLKLYKLYSIRLSCFKSDMINQKLKAKQKAMPHVHEKAGSGRSASAKRKHDHDDRNADFSSAHEKSRLEGEGDLLGQRLFGNDFDYVNEKLDNVTKTLPLPWLDYKEDSGESDDSNVGEHDDAQRKRGIFKNDAAAWVDEDDDAELTLHSLPEKTTANLKLMGHSKVTGASYRSALMRHFERSHGNAEWNILDCDFQQKQKHKETNDGSDDVDEESDHDSLTSVRKMTRKQTVDLPSGSLEIKRLTNLNQTCPTGGKVMSLQFHSSSQIALVAGMDNRLNLFQVDGQENGKIQSLFLEEFPIFTAQFSIDGSEVVMGSIHRSIKYYDMLGGQVVAVPSFKSTNESSFKYFRVSPDGKFYVFLGSYGFMHLMTAKSKEIVASLKMNGSVFDVAFSRDASRMFSFGDDGEVYVWNMNTRDCIHRFTDQGCVKGTRLHVSPQDQFLAAASNTGVVNLYDLNSCLLESHPEPIKSVMNLRTSCCDTRFNSSSELLAMCSDQSSKALKLLHTSTCSIVENFPSLNDKMGTPCCIDFSLNSGYLALGNLSGKVLLYRLKHYGSY